MEQKKINKIAVIALLFALIATTQTSAIKTALNYTFHAGDNITIIDDGIGNITISTNASIGSDTTKLNKSGDNLSTSFILYTNKSIYLNASNFMSLSTLDSHFFIDGGLIFTNLGNTIFDYVSGYSLFSHYTNVDMTNHNLLNCGNCLTNETMAHDTLKVNKSGDNITGAMPQIRGADNATIGVNGWNNLNGLGGNFVGSSFTTLVTNRLYNETTGSYYNATYANATGEGLAVFSGSLITSPAILFYSFEKNKTTYAYQGKIENTGWSIWMGNFTVNSLSGSGNDYACLDSTGKLFRSDTAC